MKYAERLKSLRLENELTQSELAKKANLATSCIAMIESGKREPSAHTVVSLANALNVTTDYLLGLEDDFGIRIDSKELIERPDYDLADKQLTDLMKLFKVMTEVQKAQVLGFAIGMLENIGVNVKAILGY